MTFKTVVLSIVLLFYLISLPESCVEPFTSVLDETNSAPLLVVDGQITNQEGPFRIRLSTSVPVNSNSYPAPVSDADIKIYDDKGDLFNLRYAKDGWYETADKKLKGVPGYAYTLSITTGDGIQYESSPELMMDVPEIDSVYFEEVKHTSFENGNTNVDTWLNILLDTHDPSGQTKYWQFNFQETWQVKMLTDSVIVRHSPTDPSDYTLENITIDNDHLNCWVTRPSTSINIATTVNSPADDIKRFLVQSLAPDEDKLHIRYSILVTQSAISKESYDFRKRLKDVNENLGSLYDIIPGQIFGNISCCDGSSKTLGYFSAVSLSSKRIFIDKSETGMQTESAYNGCSYFDYSIPEWIPKVLLGKITKNGTDVYCSADYCADCRAYGTNIKPDFWVNAK